ncbi:iron-containing redox enzyme family protein [Stigmatella sp. ncwal1]|uniref:Iron-containing redox enzyme family protein n=1 Tax=Stigmatella ashevillensis TaxID=2995309 RepID=A0ABT5DMJ1_9BACT|nr:iron-containing redox enzyme family protein [Stigmatella ashevillena]MDC0714880.1 iron-containing redox enzyme family protein [Stigmatella ashevillena]
MRHDLTELVQSEISPEEFVNRLQAIAVDSPAVKHPLLLAIGRGDFVDMRAALKDLLSQYYFYSYRFTQYLSAVTSRLESPQHRASLMGNMAEEAGKLDPDHEEELRQSGIDPDDARYPHPVLFRRFLTAVGMDARQLLEETPDVATVAWIETFHGVCSTGSQEQVAGALGVATEGIVRYMYGYLLKGIQKAWPELSRRDRVFFDLHAMVDDDHAEVLRKIAVDLAKTPKGRMDLAVGTLKALDARRNFFDHMYLRLQRQVGQASQAA